MVVDSYFIRGFCARYTDATNGKVIVTVGKCADDGNDVLMASKDVIDIDPTITGVNGLDTGSLASNTLYKILVIMNSTTGDVGCLIHKFSDAPVMPNGYDKKRIIAYMRTIDNEYVLRFQVQGGGFVKYNRYLDNPQYYHVILASGDAVDWTDVDCSSRTYPGCESATFCVCNFEGSIKPAYVREDGDDTLGHETSVHECSHHEIPLRCPGNVIEYKSGKGGLTYIAVKGYDLLLGPGYEELPDVD